MLRGTGLPNMDTLISLAHALRVSLDELATGHKPNGSATESPIRNVLLLERFRDLESLPKEDQAVANEADGRNHRRPQCRDRSGAGEKDGLSGHPRPVLEAAESGQDRRATRRLPVREHSARVPSPGDPHLGFGSTRRRLHRAQPALDRWPGVGGDESSVGA